MIETTNWYLTTRKHYAEKLDELGEGTAICGAQVRDQAHLNEHYRDFSIPVDKRKVIADLPLCVKCKRMVEKSK